MGDEYTTLEGPAEGIYREKGSRFMAFGFPVHHEDEVKKIMGRLKKEYHDARHHCYAYRISKGEETERQSDGGEPSGTAGRPILQAIQAADMENVLVIVVRYFGGVLLGRNRLAHAYRSAAAKMFSRARVATRCRERLFRLRFPYGKVHEVMKILKDEGIAPIRPFFENTCSMDISIRESLIDHVHERLNAVENLHTSPHDNAETVPANEKSKLNQ
jgi:uncharacterized YigZ family protein